LFYATILINVLTLLHFGQDALGRILSAGRIMAAGHILAFHGLHAAHRPCVVHPWYMWPKEARWAPAYTPKECRLSISPFTLLVRPKKVNGALCPQWIGPLHWT